MSFYKNGYDALPLFLTVLLTGKAEALRYKVWITTNPILMSLRYEQWIEIYFMIAAMYFSTCVFCNPDSDRAAVGLTNYRGH